MVEMSSFNRDHIVSLQKKNVTTSALGYGPSPSDWSRLTTITPTIQHSGRKKGGRRTKQLFKGCDPEVDFCSFLIDQNLGYMFNLESPDFSQFYWFNRSIYRTQHTVVFWPRFNAKQQYKEKSSKGKGTGGKVQRKPAACFQEYFPSTGCA